MCILGRYITIKAYDGNSQGQICYIVCYERNINIAFCFNEISLRLKEAGVEIQFSCPDTSDTIKGTLIHTLGQYPNADAKAYINMYSDYIYKHVNS